MTVTLACAAGAGLSPKTLPKSRLLFSFVLTVEVWCLSVLVLTLIPALPQHSYEAGTLVGICLSGIALQGR